MPEPSFQLSLVIPCFNETARMHNCIRGIEAFQTAAGKSVEVILVDDGSTDGTGRLANELGSGLSDFRVLSRPHLGKGAALKAGVANSTGKLVFLADADWSMPPSQVQRFLIPGSATVVRIGSRETPDSKRHNEPVRRHLIGRAFNSYVRRLALPEIQDSQCGFKCLPGDLARSIFAEMTTKGWAFDVELLLRVRGAGVPVEEVGIDWHYDPDTRLHPLRDAVKMAWEVFSIARRIS